MLLEHAELWLERGEHVSLVGPNGAGKTTLIETLAGRRELAAGRLSTGHNVRIGYLSQHAEELGAGGPPEQSVLDAAQRATGLSPNRARALLGRFLFSGEEAEKPLSGLSGGERRRLSLAVLVGAGSKAPNVLILDEPTNHLDLDSREALEDALRAFPGAILLVSHDRALLDAVGTRTVAVEDGDAAQLHRRLARVRAHPRGAPVRRRHVRRRLREPGRDDERDGAVTAGEARGGSAGADGGDGPAARPARARAAERPRAKGPSKNRLSEQEKAERAVEDGRGRAARARGRARRPRRVGDAL